MPLQMVTDESPTFASVRPRIGAHELETHLRDDGHPITLRLARQVAGIPESLSGAS
jgi:hypothetical protein